MSEIDNNLNETDNVEEVDASKETSVNECSSESEKEGSEDGKGKKKSFFANKQNSGETKKLVEELDSQKKATEEIKDRYMRMAAEYENYKRRTAKEMELRYSDAKADTLKKLLPVLDDFERAMAIEIPAECVAYNEGIKMIYNKLLETLATLGVEEIKAVGEVFNPELHYAVMHVDDENLGENTIAEVFEKGYRIGDKVLRYSMVKVAN